MGGGGWGFPSGQLSQAADNPRACLLRHPVPPRNSMPTQHSATADLPVHLQEASDKVDAISRVMAVVEFDLDGTILEANENFLSAVGYSSNEIVGRHHRMFVAPKDAESEEYSALWRRLRAGELMSGQFRRITKGGQEVWIQASYNPLFDAEGSPYKVVKFATDITAQVVASRARETFITEASEILKGMANGNLAAKLRGTYGAELDSMKDSINEVVQNMATAISMVIDNATPLASASEELSATSQQLSSSSEETNGQAQVVEEATRNVAQNIEVVVAGTRELSASIHEIARSSADATVIASSAVDAARETNETMSQLDERSQEIGQVIKVITSIAQQTNLLALNATIEAARAGDAGKGFAVVANEVKELAKETARATEDIGRKIDAIQAVTKVSVSAIENISSIILKISETQNIIAAAVDEQTATTNEMSRSVSDADDRAREIVAGIGGVVAASGHTSEGAVGVRSAASELAVMASRMSEVVSKFQL